MGQVRANSALSLEFLGEKALVVAKLVILELLEAIIVTISGEKLLERVQPSQKKA